MSISVGIVGVGMFGRNFIKPVKAHPEVGRVALCDMNAERLAEQGLSISLTDAAREWLANEGFEPQLGARPLRRTLQRYVENPLSIRLLEGTFNEGDTVQADAENGKIVFRRQDEMPPPTVVESATLAPPQ